MPRDIIHVEGMLLVVEEDPVDDGAERRRVVVDVGHYPVQPMGAWKTCLRARVTWQQPWPRRGVIGLWPPLEGYEDSLSDIVEDGQDSGPACQVQEVFPPGRGVQ